MALEALSSTDLFNVIIYDTISASSTLLEQPAFDFCAVVSGQQMGRAEAAAPERRRGSAAAQGRKKRRRRTRSCKNKEEAETQRMTHIAVERNRRRQMNEHLAVLRSLMPQSYVQRGDQASIVGGAIEFVKELERLLQSLEARKLQILLQQQQATPTTTTTNEEADLITSCSTLLSPSSMLSQFFPSPQYSCSSQQEQLLNKYTSRTKAAAANVEVTLIETHANLRILSRRIPRQLSKLVTGLHSLSLTILHMNVTTMDPYLVIYSISAKVEEGCQLSSVDDIAGAVHHMLRIIEEEGSCLVST